MAERQGFEPWERLRAQRFSRPPRSTTPAPLHYNKDQTTLYLQSNLLNLLDI